MPGFEVKCWLVFEAADADAAEREAERLVNVGEQAILQTADPAGEVSLATEGDPERIAMKQAALDFNKRYAVAEYPGIAFYLRGYVEHDDEDTEWSGIRAVDRERVVAVMVGDDREHIVEIEDLSVLADEDYCGVCGQIGCEHDGRSE